MQVTWEKFYKCVREIEDYSESICDGWNIRGTDEGYASYLTKKKLLTNNESEILTVEYHVAFSMSYGTPMLCLNVWRPDGSMLTMEECWSRLNFATGEDMYTTLTQMDHPVLLRPFLTLHPCKTAEILNQVASSKNPVVSWLSVVSPLVKLDLDLNYAKLTM